MIISLETATTIANAYKPKSKGWRRPWRDQIPKYDDLKCPRPTGLTFKLHCTVPVMKIWLCSPLPPLLWVFIGACLYVIKTLHIFMTSGKSESNECLKMLAPKGVQKFCRIAGFGLIYCDSKCPLSYIYSYIYFLYIFGGKAGAQQLRCPLPRTKDCQWISVG